MAKGVQKYEKLSAYAARMRLKYPTVWRQYKRGALPQVVKINGSLFMPLEKLENKGQGSTIL